MADDSDKKDGPALPPKLSIPKTKGNKPVPTGQPKPKPAPAASPQPVPKPAAPSEAGTIKLKPIVRPGPKPAPQPPQAAPGDQGKESTMRITLPESGIGKAPGPAPQSQVPTIRKGPPTKTLVRPGAKPAPQSPPAGGAAAEPPAPVVQATPQAPAAGAPAAKKETSRIPLEAASAAPAAGVVRATEGPKTIRITPKPAGGPATIKLKPRPSAAAPKLGATATSDEKKKTSRIPLDAALTSGEDDAAPADAEAPAVGGPKTIRLKRPGAGPALKVGAQDGEKVGLGATSKIEQTAKIEAEEEQPPTPTRRKTIKVKRPGQQPSLKTGPKTAPAAAAAAPEPVPQVIQDEPSWFFPVVTILAIFVVIATIYVFCSEAIGPNPSLTQLSYYVEGPDLGMPMKIAPPQRYSGQQAPPVSVPDVEPEPEPEPEPQL